MAQRKSLYPRTLKRLEDERFERRHTSEAKKHARNKLASKRAEFAARDKTTETFMPPQKPPWAKHDRKGTVYLQLPERLDLVGDFETAARFVRAIHLSTFRDKKPVQLIFDRASDIRPAALLLLLAEIDRCRRVHGHNYVTGTYPKNSRLERILDETGFFKLLRVRSRYLRPVRKFPFEYINFRSEIGLAAKEPRKLREALLGDAIEMEVKARTRLQRSLTEAMLNVGHHAYPKGAIRGHQHHGRWWLAGHVKKVARELMVTFCDLGVGIPSTLPRKYPLEMIRAAVSLLPGIRPDDGEMIRAGMILGRTSTAEINRGRGLNDMKSLIDHAGAGELHIFSRRGWYRYRTGGDEKIQNFATSIGGTLIKWTVPLDRITDWESDHEVDPTDDTDS